MDMREFCTLCWDSEKFTFVEMVYLVIQGRKIQPVFGVVKEIPIHAWRIPEGFRSLRPPDLMAIGT